MRGERLVIAGPPGQLHGSSPHARGTRLGFPVGLGFQRFIPACAGNATLFIPSPRRSPVHPRMRGERALELGELGDAGGSSPHARGTPPFEVPAIGRLRFIPACAGNAMIPSSSYTVPSVHPRMRGERAGYKFLFKHADGSSPHARGTPPAGLLSPARLRFIPACAGNALTAGPSLRL